MKEVQSINLPTADVDAASRRRIVSETDKNFFVEAGAGSGKTTLLVHRMTAMVEQGKDIRRICAITFTKAAANEFYDRFRKLLLKRSHEESEADRFLPPTTKESRARCEAALKDIDLCFMGTIDAFCNRILGEHPSEAGLPSELSLISDEEMEGYLRQAYVRMSRGELGEELKTYADLLRRLTNRPEDVFSAGAAFLLKHRNAQFHFEQTGGQEVRGRLAAYRPELLRAVRALVEHPEKMSDKHNADSIAAWQNLPEILRTLTEKWEYHYSSVLYAIKQLGGLRLGCEPEEIGTSRGELLSDFIYRKKYSGTTIDADNPLFQKMRGLVYDLALTFLSAALPVLEAELKALGTLSYFDYLYYLRNMLREDAEKGGKLTAYIANAHSYYLIDEFQDTDPLQAEVFFYLSSQTPQAKWSDCRPREGSLFIVGDPKQSIYRFRDADVTAFLRVKSLFEDPAVGEVLPLTRNFRSTKTLRNYFNRCFTKLLPSQTEVQSRYDPIPIEEEEEETGWGGIFRYPSYAGKLTDVHPELTDEKQVGRIIRQMTETSEYKIWDRDKKELRPLKYSDFMLITINKKSLVGYSKELERLGIPCRVEGNVPFDDCPAFRAVSEVYQAAVRPKDGMAVYVALKGAVFGLSEEEIKAFRAAGGRLEVPGDESELTGNAAYTAVPAAGYAMKALCSLEKRAGNLTPASLFAAIAAELRVFIRCGSRNAEIFWYAQEKLREGETAGVLNTHKEAAKWLKALGEGDSGEERCLSLQTEPNAVHLANLHKIKGLEAPVVILASASPAKNKGSDHRIEYGADAADGFLFKLKQGKGYNESALIQTSHFTDKENEEKSALAAERDRQIYVAATRAKNVLIISERMEKGGKDNPEKIYSRWQPLIEEETPYLTIKSDTELGPVKASAEILTAEELYEEAEQEDLAASTFAIEASYILQTPSHLEVPSKLEEENRTEDQEEMAAETDKKEAVEETPKEPSEDDPYGLHHRLAATLGTMTHRLMEMLVSSGFRISPEDAVKEIISEYGAELSAGQVAALQTALLGAGKTMLAGGFPQENGSAQDLFAELKTAEEIYCELPFTYRDDSETPPVLWDGVIDLVYKKEGQWFIVDYKTNADGRELDAHYAGQLEAYKKAFQALTGETAEARVYHVGV